MLQTLKNKKKQLPQLPTPGKDIAGDVSDVAQKIGRDWFDTVTKKDVSHPRPNPKPKEEEKKSISEPSNDEKTEREE